MRREMMLAAAVVATLTLGQGKAQAFHPTDVDVVASFYPKYLHRGLDKGGMRYWRDELHHGLPVREIEARILASDEYFRLHGMSSEGFVQGLLTDVNGQATPDRLGFFLGRLQSTGSRLAVAREVLGLAVPPVVVVQPQPQPVVVQPQPQPVYSQSPPVVEVEPTQPQPQDPGYVPTVAPQPTYSVVPAPTTVIVPQPVYVPAYAPGPVYYPRYYAPYRPGFSLNLVLPIGRR